MNAGIVIAGEAAGWLHVENNVAEKRGSPKQARRAKRIIESPRMLPDDLAVEANGSFIAERQG